MFPSKCFASAAILAAAIAFAEIHATSASVIETDSTQSGKGPFTPTYTVPAGDILNGLAPTAFAPSLASFTQEGTGGTPVLTNGVFGTITGTGGSNPDLATAGGGITDGGTSLTYTLPTPYTLSSIVTMGGWNDSGRDTQIYTVSYGIGGVFTPLASVNYNPGGSEPTASQVTLTGFSIPLVTQIRFDFGNAANNNGHQGYAELAAFGKATPEPSSLVMIGLGVVGLFVAARRRRKG